MLLKFGHKAPTAPTSTHGRDFDVFGDIVSFDPLKKYGNGPEAHEHKGHKGPV